MNCMFYLVYLVCDATASLRIEADTFKIGNLKLNKYDVMKIYS